MFTARYALSPYIAQIWLVFKGLILQAVLVKMSLITESIEVFVAFLLQWLGIYSFGDVAWSYRG